MCVERGRWGVGDGADGRGVVVERTIGDRGWCAGWHARVVIIGWVLDRVEDYYLFSLGDLRDNP